ncbi:MAG: biopolymer transporter ExbD [Aquabacterium sp.]|nr:biopolymer transporter ExbD [Ferruginibacter sp.]
MPKVKIPRKSTVIDMTAMCDVAFLLLSFFILATKQKPPEAVTVISPSSVSNKVAKEEAILITLNKEGKVYLLLGDKAHKEKIIDDVNRLKALGLTPAELAKLKKADFIGLPFNQLKSYLNMTVPMSADKMPGIPTGDSTNNELTDWMRSVVNSYSGENMENLNLLVKGDNAAKYPEFKNVKTAFKKNDIYKFKIVTNPEGVPTDSELYRTATGGDK